MYWLLEGGKGGHSLQKNLYKQILIDTIGNQLFDYEM